MCTIDMNLYTISTFGGVFALLVFIHFVVDWIFQSHDEAMKKANDAIVRAKHCVVYSIGFFVPLWFFGLTTSELIYSMLILFVSHFIEDTYYPVMLWAKHVRQHPHFEYEDDHDAFIKFTSEPLGKILAIVVDQLVHIFFLLPIAWFIVR